MRVPSSKETFSLMLVLGCGASLGCVPAIEGQKIPFEEGDADTDTDADADADSDADADADTDTDADSDSDLELEDVALTLDRDDFLRYEELLAATDSEGFAVVEGSEITGRVSYQSTLGSDTLCDFDVSFKGSEYTGDCPDCEWAFEIYDWRKVEDDSAVGCYADAMIALTPTSTYRNLVLAFKPVYTTTYYYYDYGYGGTYGTGTSFYNVLQTGYIYDSSSYYYGGTWWRTLTYDGSRYGEVRQDGDEFAWTWAQSYTRLYPTEGLWGYCGYYDWGASSRTMFMGDTPEPEDLPCGTYAVDAWKFDAEAGEDYTLSVDTVADDSAGWSYVYVADASSCLDTVAYGSTRCSHGGYDCPSLRMTAADSGTHTAFVMADSCVGGRGFEYQIDVQRVVE